MGGKSDGLFQWCSFSAKLYSRHNDAIQQAAHFQNKTHSQKIDIMWGVIKSVVEQIAHLWGHCFSALWKLAVFSSHPEHWRGFYKWLRLWGLSCCKLRFSPSDSFLSQDQAAHFNSKVRQGTWSMKPHNSFFLFSFSFVLWFLPPGNSSFIFQIYRGWGGEQDKFQGKIPWQHGFSPAQNISGSICDKGKADLHQKGQKLEAFNKCKPHLVCKWNKQLDSVSGFISKLLQGMQHFARAFPRWRLRFVHRLFKWGSEAYKTEPTSNTKSLLAHANVKWLEPSKTSPSVLKVRLPFMF